MVFASTRKESKFIYYGNFFILEKLSNGKLKCVFTGYTDKNSRTRSFVSNNLIMENMEEFEKFNSKLIDIYSCLLRHTTYEETMKIIRFELDTLDWVVRSKNSPFKNNSEIAKWLFDNWKLKFGEVYNKAVKLYLKAKTCKYSKKSLNTLCDIWGLHSFRDFISIEEEIDILDKYSYVETQ